MSKPDGTCEVCGLAVEPGHAYQTQNFSGQHWWGHRTCTESAAKQASEAASEAQVLAFYAGSGATPIEEPKPEPEDVEAVKSLIGHRVEAAEWYYDASGGEGFAADLTFDDGRVATFSGWGHDYWGCSIEVAAATSAKSPQPDEINALVLRCEATRQRAEAKNAKLPLGEQTSVQELVIHGHADGEISWIVGFHDGSKRQMWGDTLAGTLQAWLDEYEHQWDERPEVAE